MPISIGILVGSGFVFRLDAIYSLSTIPSLIWSSISYFFGQQRITLFVGIIVLGQTWSAFIHYSSKSFDEIINPRGQDRIVSLLDYTAMYLGHYVIGL